MLVPGPPLGGACRVGACPPRWWCVLWIVVICWVGSGCGCVVGLAGVGVVLVRAPSPVGACRVCACPPPWWGVLCRRVLVLVRCVVAGWMPGWFCWFAVVSAAVRPALSGGGCLWCLPGRGCCCAGARIPSWLGVLCWCVLPPMVGRAVLVCGPPHGGACCVGLWSPSWWGVLCWCVPPSWWGVLYRCVPPPPPWSGVLRWFAAPLVVGRAALVRGAPLGGECRVGACPPRWWCVVWVYRHLSVCWVGSGCGCVVGLAGVGVVLVRAPSPVGACRVCAWPPPWWSVLCLSVRVSVRGIVAGWMPGWFCWFAVVSAAVRPALLGVGCLWCLPGRGWCCAGACPPPPLVGRVALVCGPPHGGACCVGAWPPSCWGVPCWCPPAALVVFGLGCRRPLGALWSRLFCWLGRGWRCASACAPPCWGVPCLCVAPPLVGRAVSACSGFGSWCCSRLDARLVLFVCCCLCRRTAGVVECWLSVVFAWPGLVLCWCVPPPPVGACRACAWPPPWWRVLCRRVRVSVRGVVAGWMLGLFCWCAVVSADAGVFVVFSWPGRTGQPPERVWCATPLSWPGRTGRPPERVRCATPCFCFAGIVSLPLVFPCSLVSVRFLASRWCLSPPAAVPPPPGLPLAVFCPPLCFLVSRARRWLCPLPPPGGMPFASAGVLLRVYPCFLCALWLLCAAWPFVGASCSPPPRHPSPPRVVFPGCWPLPLVFLCPPASALFFPGLWPWHLFGWVSFCPLGSRWCRLPPPPRRLLLVVCGAPRLVLWCCGWVVLLLHHL